MKVTCPICKAVLEFEPATGAERAAMVEHLRVIHPGYRLENRAQRRARRKGGRHGHQH